MFDLRQFSVVRNPAEEARGIRASEVLVDPVRTAELAAAGDAREPFSIE